MYKGADSFYLNINVVAVREGIEVGVCPYNAHVTLFGGEIDCILLNKFGNGKKSLSGFKSFRILPLMNCSI